MDEKHTAGPWGISSESDRIIKAFDSLGETSIIIGSASGYTGSPFFPNDETAAANARLMAAAPQLVAAARQALEDCADLMATPAGDALATAIAKATGSAA